MLGITDPVALNFGVPICGVTLHSSPAVDALGAAVPETAMHEKAYPSAGKDHIGLARKVPAVNPEAQAGAVQKTPDGEFRRRVPAADTRHVLAALQWG
jgi:hypothetical protein